MMLSGFIGSLSQNMLSSALPAIMEGFGVSAPVAQWLTTGYILVMGIMTAVTAFALMALLSAGGVALSVLVPKKPNGAD